MNDGESPWASLAVFLVETAVACWLMMSPDVRRLAIMRVARAVETIAGALALRAGRLAMSRELVGAHPGYELPETLSRLRDFARRFYERARP